MRVERDEKNALVLESLAALSVDVRDSPDTDPAAIGRYGQRVVAERDLRLTRNGRLRAAPNLVGAAKRLAERPQ
jgi:hypothetical protein